MFKNNALLNRNHDAGSSYLIRKSHAKFDRRTIPASAQEGIWTAADGWKLRQFSWASDFGSPRGSILFLTGRADFYEKYLETFNDFHEHGWNITTIDWRGQGGSGRCGPHRHVGHIEDFSIWTDDLSDLYKQWRTSNPAPHVVIGHSMGGQIVMRALVEQTIDPDAVILSAPMLAPAGKGMHPWAAQLAAKFMCAIGRAKRAAWKAYDNPLEPDIARQRLLTHDTERYHDEFFWLTERPDLRLGPPSWRWVERAYASAAKLRKPIAVRKVTTPILFLVTAVDELVDNTAIEVTHQLLPNSDIEMFGQESAHEIYREVDAVRNQALDASFQFLDEFAPRK